MMMMMMMSLHYRPLTTGKLRQAVGDQMLMRIEIIRVVFQAINGHTRWRLGMFRGVAWLCSSTTCLTPTYVLKHTH